MQHFCRVMSQVDNSEVRYLKHHSSSHVSDLSLRADKISQKLLNKCVIHALDMTTLNESTTKMVMTPAP